MSLQLTPEHEFLRLAVIYNAALWRCDLCDGRAKVAWNGLPYTGHVLPYIIEHVHEPGCAYLVRDKKMSATETLSYEDLSVPAPRIELDVEDDKTPGQD